MTLCRDAEAISISLTSKELLQAAVLFNSAWEAALTVGFIQFHSVPRSARTALPHRKEPGRISRYEQSRG